MKGSTGASPVNLKTTLVAQRYSLLVVPEAERSLEPHEFKTAQYIRERRSTLEQCFLGLGRERECRSPDERPAGPPWPRGKDTDKNMPLSDAYDLPVLLGISATLVLILTSSQIPQATDGDMESRSSLPNVPPCMEEREAGRRLRRWGFKGSAPHTQTPLRRADERQALYRLVLVSSHPPC